MMKSRKNDTELEHLKDAFNRTDNAVRAIRDYIENNNNISEFDIAVQLAKEFKNQGALGLSFSSIVAKDANSALAHYSKSSKDEIITDDHIRMVVDSMEKNRVEKVHVYLPENFYDDDIKDEKED